MMRWGAILYLLLPASLSSAQQTENFETLARRAEAEVGTHPAAAVPLYQQALTLNPRWAEGWLYLGASLLELGRFAESRDALRRGAELEPSRGTPWAYLGMAEYQLGEYKAALSHILRGESAGLADRPEFIAAVRYRAASICLLGSDFGGALEQLRPLVRAGDDSPGVILALGLSALFIDSVPDKVQAARRPVIDLAGRAAWAFLAERADLAAPLFEKLVAQYPAERGVHYMLGVFLLERDAGAAQRAFEEELRFSPSHVPARVQLALLLMTRGEAALSQKFAREAVRLDPANPLCQATLGRALLSAGQISLAIAALEKSVRLAPEASRTHFYLQQAYQRAGRVADAATQKAEFNRLRALQEPVTVGTPQ